MLLQDNAAKMQHNQKVVDQRERALKKTMAFRAPIQSIGNPSGGSVPPMAQ